MTGTSSPSDNPLISVVTPCMNRAGFVAEAIESVLRQEYPRFEHIVVDGGSTDGTLDVLARYPHLRVICEPDRSLYDALNKGLCAARGEVIAHLNTDDLFPPGTLGAVAREFVARPEVDVVYGGSTTFRTDPSGTGVVLTEDTDRRRLEFTLRNALFRPISINARFFHRRVYEAVGLYDWTYKIAGDREFFLRAFLTHSLRTAFLPRVLYLYRHHAGSLTFNDVTFSEKISSEHLRMTETLLRTVGRTRAAEVPLRRLHSLEALGLVGHALRNRRWWTAVGYGIRGCSVDSGWPVEFIVAAARRLLGGGKKSLPAS